MAMSVRPRLPLAYSHDVCKLQQQRGRNTIIICYPNSKSYKWAARKVRQFPPDKALTWGMTQSGHGCHDNIRHHTCTGSCCKHRNTTLCRYKYSSEPRRCPLCSLLWHRLRFFVRRLRVTKLISSVSRRPCRNCQAEKYSVLIHFILSSLSEINAPHSR